MSEYLLAVVLCVLFPFAMPIMIRFLFEHWDED